MHLLQQMHRRMLYLLLILIHQFFHFLYLLQFGHHVLLFELLMALMDFLAPSTNTCADCFARLSRGDPSMGTQAVAWGFDLDQ